MVNLQDLIFGEHTLGKAAITGSFHVLTSKTLRTEFSIHNSVRSWTYPQWSHLSLNNVFFKTVFEQSRALIKQRK